MNVCILTNGEEKIMVKDYHRLLGLTVKNMAFF